MKAVTLAGCEVNVDTASWVGDPPGGIVNLSQAMKLFANGVTSLVKHTATGSRKIEVNLATLGIWTKSLSR